MRYTSLFCQGADYQLYIVTRAFFIFLTSQADEERRINDGTNMHKQMNIVTVYFLQSSSALSKRCVTISRRKKANNIFLFFLTVIFKKCNVQTTCYNSTMQKKTK